MNVICQQTYSKSNISFFVKLHCLSGDHSYLCTRRILSCVLRWFIHLIILFFVISYIRNYDMPLAS